jgi:hypothetical protein
MNLSYSALWQYVHDTLTTLEDHVATDLDLVDDIVDKKYLAVLSAAAKDKAAFAATVKE